MTEEERALPLAERWREKPAERLGEMVRRRRYRLGLTQHAVVERGGPSIVTLRQIENAKLKRPRGGTFEALDEALAWVPGSARAAWLDGKDPVAVENSPPEGEVDRRFVSPRQQDLAYVAHRHPDDPSTGGMSDDEVAALIRETRRLADELERRITRGSAGPVDGAP